ncbi:hypothetical protein B0H11DRAFT_2018529 [Mycena galericulata]|nr:hypothetical protein B0H11DRAFT_2018529 [Mycena galericulata]
MPGEPPPQSYIPFVSLETLRRCTRCMRVAYCDQACQLQDWTQHKMLCKKLQEVNAYDMKNGHTLFDPNRRLQYYVSEEVNRCEIFRAADPPSGFGGFDTLITYGEKCQVCFRTPFHDAQYQFSACRKCKLAWWCSPECEKRFSDSDVHSPQQCEGLCTLRAIESVKIAYALARRSHKHVMISTHGPSTSYIPPSTLSGWADYHKRITPDFKTDARSFAREFQNVHPDATRAIELLATDSTSIVLTLLSALETALPNLQTRSTICIHIVAAASRELHAKAMLEELLHSLPKLKVLTVVYVGPEVFHFNEPQNLACSACQRMGRRRTAIRSSIKYHEFVRSPEYKANPSDLVAGFNTGMGEVETAGWKKSMGIVLDNKIPAVFTAYTKFEAFHDTTMLLDLGAFFLKFAQRNPWRGVIPTIQERFQQYHLDHYSNNYLFIVRGRELRELQMEPLD